MKTLEQVKKFEYVDIYEGWIDDNKESTNKSYVNENGQHVEKNYFEKLEKTVIDGIEYVYVMYMYGEGMVIADETQRHTIKVSELKNEGKTQSKELIKNSNENKLENKNATYTHILNNDIVSIHKFKDDSIIMINDIKYKVRLKNYVNLTDEEIEIAYGGYAVEDDDIKQYYSTQYIYDYKQID